MRTVSVPHDLTILTNEVSSTCLVWQEYECDILKNNPTAPLIVSQVYRGRQRAYIILDGNHRACLLVKHQRRITALLLVNTQQASEILTLEGEGTIPRFPHRGFLAGEMTFRELIVDAIRAAQNLNCTIEQMLERLI
jgi:hypothetical protein